MAVAPELEDRVTALRAQGASWDEINGAVGQRISDLRARGATDAELGQALGYKDPTEAMAKLRASFEANQKANPVPPQIQVSNPIEAFQMGTENSSLGLMTRGQMSRGAMPQQSGMAMRLANEVGGFAGDIPAMILGGIIGAGTAGVGGATAGAAVPVAGETGVSEVAGGVTGATLGAGAGAFALPTFIKDNYIDGLTKGVWKSPEDFAARTGGILWDTTKSGLTGAATSWAGGRFTEAAGEAFIAANPLKALAGKSVAELTAMTAASSALAGKLPTKEDIIDGALFLAALHTAGHIRSGGEVISNLKTNLADHWKTTDQSILATAHQALTDPVLRQKLISTPTPKVLAGSAGHPTDRFGDFVIGRQSGAFDDAVKFMINQQEGGAHTVIDTGGVTKYGISQKANPDIDVKNLSEAQAEQLYHDRYWSRIGADNIQDPKLRTAAFDAAVNQGVGPTMAWLKESGGDLQKFMALRTEQYAKLIKNDPETYGRYEPAWNQRMANLGMNGTIRQARPDVFGEPGPEGQTVIPPALAEREPSAAEPAPAPTDPMSDRDYMLSRFAPEDKAPSILENLGKFAYDNYLELFNPEHPVHKLVYAIQQGRPLEDAENPRFLYRMAELSNTLSQYMVRENMIDTEGNTTGPGLLKIIDQFKGQKEWGDFLSYAMARWASEKALQAKETGVEVDRANAHVAAMEEGGLQVPGEDLAKQNERIGVSTHELHPMDPAYRVGPHYSITTKSIHMLPAEHALYSDLNLPYDAVYAHETGHAIAHSIDENIARGTWETRISPKDADDLHDELEIVSRQFKPSMWKDLAQRGHVTKNSELIADAIATWMTDPTARARMPEFARLMPADELAKLGAIPEKYGTKVQQAFDQLVQWQNGTFRFLYKSGILGRDAYVKSVAENQSRIPGYREDAGGGTAGPGPGKTSYNPVHRFFGSTSRVKGLLKSLLQEGTVRVELATRNIANKALADAAEPLMLAGKEAAPPFKFTLTPDEMVKFGVGEVGDDEHGNPEIYRRLSVGLQADQVPIFRDGQREAWKFEDPQITRFLRGYDTKTLATWQKVAATVTNRLTKPLIVLNPLFPVHLMGYDVPWQFITKPGFRNTLADVFVGLGHVVGNTDTYGAWMRSGGAERVFGGLSMSDFIKDTLRNHGDPSIADGVTNAMLTPYHALRGWGQMLSSAQRVGRFARGMNEGESQLRAGVASSEAAFHRAGFGGAAAKMQNALTPFFSAYLNSMEQTVRGQLGGLIPRLTGGKDLNQTITGEAFNGLQFSAKAIGLITLPMLANYYLNKDKDWYKAAPDWQKDNGLFFHIGPDDGGHTIFFKYPPLVSLLYGGIPRRMVAAYHEDNPHELDHMGASLGASLLPTGGLLTYNVFLPIVEHMANHSFFRDSPLTSDGVAKAMAPEQYTNYSSQTAINLSKFVNDIPILKGAHLSPIDIDNYMQGWGPGMGTAAVKASEMALGANKHAPTPTLEDWPLLSSFFERYPSSNSQQMKDFEERMRDFDAVHASLRKTLEQGDLSRFQEIAGQNPTASAAHALRLQKEPLPSNAAEFSSTLRTAVKGADIPDARTILEADVAMKNGRQYVANVYANDKLSPNDKRQLITQAYSQLQVIAEKGIAAMDKAGL